jgi:DNA-binding CsgD family transcriptional regulator
MVNLVRAHWGLGSRVLADIFMPNATAAERDAFVDFQRESAPAEGAALSLEAVYSFDARDRLAAVDTPTLVLHRRGDRAIPLALGQDIASRIPGATLLPLPGSDHLPWHGDAGATANALLGFLGVADPAVEIEPPPAPGTDPTAARAETDLSERELEVLRLVAIGLSDREIAERLVLSPHTVHRHVANVRTKLRLPSRAAAAAHAARLGLL